MPAVRERPLCKYRDSLGRPGEGAHGIRLLGGPAAIDVGLTIILAIITAVVSGLSFPVALVAWFGAGIVAHRAFCVRTTVDRLLFP